MEKNSVLEELRALRDLTTGRSCEYFEAMLAGAKPVTITPLAEIFTKDEIELIRVGVQPRIKECYRNAHLMALYFPDVAYVEGKMRLGCGFSIDHAFNRRGERYFDITRELALGESVEEEGVEDYLSVGEWDADTINAVALETGTYGDIFRKLYIKNCNHGQKSSNQ